MAGVDQRAGRFVVWVTLVLAAIVALRATATGGLAPPPVTSVDALRDWSAARDPTTTAVALVRLVAELAAWYLLGLFALHGVATAVRATGQTSLADALAVPGTARLVHGGLGLGLVASTAAGAAVAEPPRPRDTPAVMQPMRSYGDETGGTARQVPRVPAPSPPAEPVVVTEAVVAAGPPAGAATMWTVSEGESFWSIAAEALTTTLGRRPADAEVDPYWRALIATNRHRLVDVEDVDLIHPGQVFELPAPSV